MRDLIYAFVYFLFVILNGFNKEEFFNVIKLQPLIIFLILKAIYAILEKMWTRLSVIKTMDLNINIIYRQNSKLIPVTVFRILIKNN